MFVTSFGPLPFGTINRLYIDTIMGAYIEQNYLMQYYDDKMYGISGCWQNMLFKRVKAIISLSSFKAWIGLPSMVRFLGSIFAFA